MADDINQQITDILTPYLENRKEELPTGDLLKLMQQLREVLEAAGSGAPQVVTIIRAYLGGGRPLSQEELIGLARNISAQLQGVTPASAPSRETAPEQAAPESEEESDSMAEPVAPASEPDQYTASPRKVQLVPAKYRKGLRPQRHPSDPAVPIEESYTREYIKCLEDGATLKFLTRHLKTYYDMTPQQYIEKWNLPADYPIVAPAYAARRKRMARMAKRQQGRGQAASA